jgi:hypothetical protein
VRHKSTRRPTSKGHGHTIQLTGGISSPPQNIITHPCYVKATKSECHLDTVHFKQKHITNPTITHADTLAECIKTITGATGGTTAQETKDL